MIAFLKRLSGWRPAPLAGGPVESLRVCTGILLGLFATALASRALLGPDTSLPMLIAPAGASAVLIFGLPASPLAQPWPVLAGNTLAALVGVACARWITDPAFATAVAGGGAVAAMYALRCLHPPGGAIAMTAVLGGPAIHALGWRFALMPVAVNSLLLVAAGLVWNNATRHRYPRPARTEPVNPHRTADPLPGERLGFTRRDLDAVLAGWGETLDIGRADLEALLVRTEMQAYQRRFGDTRCADIMSRDMVTVDFATELQEAWSLLRRHKVGALPVTDRTGRIIGILTVADFLKHADAALHRNLEGGLRALLRRVTESHSERPEVAGQIMTAPVRTIRADRPMVELVRLFSDAGLHRLPVVDAQDRLQGIVTQSDLIAALYRDRLADASSAPAARS